MISISRVLIGMRHFQHQFDAINHLTADDWVKLAFKAGSHDELSLELGIQITSPHEWLFEKIPGENLVYWIDFVDFVERCFDCALHDQRSLSDF